MYYQGENGYLGLLKDTLANGEKKTTRNGKVVSVFGCMCNFKDISTAFPLITTKKMFSTWIWSAGLMKATAVR